MLILYMNLVSSKPAESLRSSEEHSNVRGEATASQTTWQREICGKVTRTSFTLQKRWQVLLFRNDVNLQCQHSSALGITLHKPPFIGRAT